MKQQAFLFRAAGLLLTAVAILGAAPAGAQTTGTRGSRFEYDTKGLLTAEIVEPATPNLCVRTGHTLNEWGNRKNTTVQNCAGATGNAPFTSRSTDYDYAAHTVTIVGVTFNVPAGMFAISAKNPAGHVETRRFDPRFGAMVSVTGPNQLTSTFEYDDFGRKILEVAPDGNKVVTRHCVLAGDTSGNSAGCLTSPEYAPAGAVSYTETEPQNAAGTAIGPWTRQYADVLGRAVRELTKGFDGANQPSTARFIAKDTTFNEYGAAVKVTQPYFIDSSNYASVTASGAGAYGWTATEYDALGRPRTVYVRDAEGNENYAGQTVGRAAFGYDGLTTTESRVRTSKNAQGNQQAPVTLTTTRVRNALGELVEVRDANNKTLRMRYDAFGNQVETQDAHDNRVVTLFDTRGRKTELRDPNAGIWKYYYDALGQLRVQKSPTQTDAQATILTYDVLGRMTQRQEPEYRTDWTYDWCSKGIGKRCAESTTTGLAKLFNFDAYGRPSSVSQSAGTTLTAVTTYNAEGRVATYTYPTGLKVFYSYTSLGYLQEIRRDSATGQKVWTLRAANAWGKPESFDSHGDASHRTAQTFDPVTGRVNGIKVGTNMMEQTYGWDTVGNVTDRTDKYDPAANKWLSENFAYDSLNRLVSYDTTGTTTRVVTIGYDAIGNIRSKSDVGTYYYPLSGNGAVRPSAVAVVDGTAGTIGRRDYAYDAAGNMTAATAGKYGTVTYASFNLPTSLSGPGASYAWIYGADHERVRETRSSGSTTRVTTYFHPDNAGALAFEQEVTNGGTPTNRHFIAAMGRTVLMLETSGAIGSAGVTNPTEQQYWHVDHLGSLVMIADQARNMKNRFSYDPFGKRRYVGGAYEPAFALAYDTTDGSTDRGFTGHEHLDDVGIVHMNGRTFDPLIGRFMQADPVIQFNDNLQSYNRFSYVLNNPLNATDPTGHFIFAIPLAAMFANVAGWGTLTALAANPALWGQLFVAAAVGGGLNAAIMGADEKGVLRGGLSSGVSAVAFAGVGQISQSAQLAPGTNPTDWVVKTLMHAAAGCVGSKVGGGSCREGAISAGVGEGLGTFTDKLNLGMAGNGAVRMVVGGLAAQASGGKFENGALSAAFGYLFNHCSHGTCTSNFEQAAYDWWPGYKAGTLLYNQTMGDGSWTVFEVLDVASVGGSVIGNGVKLLGATGRQIKLLDGYYQVEGSAFKFSEYYYEKLWATGRGAPFLQAQEVLRTATSRTVDRMAGFYRYSNSAMEMVYNPTTKEVWHLLPLKK